MLDLTDENLHERRQDELDKFLELVVVTDSEKDSEMEEADLEDETSELTDEDINSFFSGLGADGSVVSESGLEGSLDESKEEEDEDTIFKPISELGTPYETGNLWLDLLYSPYYLFYYMFRSLHRRLRDRTNWNLFLNMLWKVSLVTALLSLSSLFVIGEVKFLFSMVVQSVLSVILFVVSFTLVRLIDMDGILDSFRHKDLHELEEDLEVTSEGFDVEGLLEEDLDIDFSDVDDEELGEEEGDQEETVRADFGMAMMGPGSTSGSLPSSTVDVNVGTDMYLNQLKSIYNSNAVYEGIEITDRAEMVKSFAPYLIENFKGFGTWDGVEDYSVVFNNILFMFYLSLVNLDNRMKNMENETTVMHVKELVENPLMYKLEVVLPEYFTERKLQSGVKAIETFFKEDEGDTEVSILVGSYQQSMVIKFFKPIRGLISLGDIMRYVDGNGDAILDEFVNVKKELPLLLGLRGNEHPTIVDLADNTSGVIAGDSGTGKSWGTFMIMLNLIISNSYNDLNIVIMDIKSAVFWREMAKLPHTVGYHTNVQDYFDILQEVRNEMDYRKELLAKIDKESWKGLRESLKRDGKTEELKAFPWLIVAIDELTNTMDRIREIAGEKNKHILERFEDDLGMIAREGRSLGIKLLLIGQRTTNPYLPRSAMASSSFKLYFQLNATSDYTKGLTTEGELRTLPLPKQKGQALLREEGTYSTPVLLRTLTLGGINDDQIVNLIRVLAFEWTRRSVGNVITEPSKLNFTYNRGKIREKVLEDMRANKLFMSGEEGTDNIREISMMLTGRGGDVVREEKAEPLLELKIEKEDSLGNVVESGVSSGENGILDRKNSKEGKSVLDKREVKITTNMYKKEAEGDIIEEGEEGYPEEVEELYEVEDILGEEVKVDTSEVSDKERERVRKKPRGRVTQSLGKRSTAKKVDKEERMEKMRKLREGVRKKNEKAVGEGRVKEDVGMSIVEYINRYGEGEVTKRIRKSDLHSKFNERDIRTELDNIRIAERGDYYQI